MKLEDGTEVDSSATAGVPAEFVLGGGRVVGGFHQAGERVGPALLLLRAGSWGFTPGLRCSWGFTPGCLLVTVGLVYRRVDAVAWLRLFCTCRELQLNSSRWAARWVCREALSCCLHVRCTPPRSGRAGSGRGPQAAGGAGGRLW